MWFLGGMGPLLRDMWREGNSEQEQVVQAEKLFGRGVPILHITELEKAQTSSTLVSFVILVSSSGLEILDSYFLTL